MSSDSINNGYLHGQTESSSLGFGMKVQNSKVLELYFRDLAQKEPLSTAEEFELAERIQHGNMEARDRLVTANLRFVIHVARAYQNCGVPLADVIGAGNMGLLKAAERFDHTKGVRFISYAVWWIRQAIQQTLAQDPRSVRLPFNRIELLHEISRATRILQQQSETEPSCEELAQATGASLDLVEDTMRWAQDVSSLDMMVGEEDPCELLALVPGQVPQSPDAALLADSLRHQIDGLLETLEEREIQVLKLALGFDGKDPQPLAQIGYQMNLSRERVRQIKEKALEKLRLHCDKSPFELLTDVAA